MAYTQEPKVIVAFDYENKNEALKLLEKLDPRLCRLKVGKAMFTQLGPEWVKFLMTKGFDVFLDLKYHDIPNTVYGACLEAAKLGVWMVNVHALGGKKMLEEAVKAVHSVKGKRPLLIGVTLLTSLQQDDLAFLNIQDSLEAMVIRLAGLCKEAGLDGVVCSPLEAPLIKQEYGEDFLCVTPGIRLESDDLGDQKRVMTPKLAVSNGADYLVIGRPITQAANPVEVLKVIEASAW